MWDPREDALLPMLYDHENVVEVRMGLRESAWGCMRVHKTAWAYEIGAAWRTMRVLLHGESPFVLTSPPPSFLSPTLQGKEAARKELRTRLGLKQLDVPIVGCITRLVAQKVGRGHTTCSCVCVHTPSNKYFILAFVLSAAHFIPHFLLLDLHIHISVSDVLLDDVLLDDVFGDDSFVTCPSSMPTFIP